jgi:monoamine oxidase
MVEVEGGWTGCPAVLPELGPHIRFGAQVTALDQTDSGVTIAYRTAAGRTTISADYAIVTVPFPVLRHMEIRSRFRGTTARDSAALLRCFGQDPGAVTATIHGRRTKESAAEERSRTSPIRNLYYPIMAKKRGVGSARELYVVGRCAALGFALPHGPIAEALDDVAEIHPQILTEYEAGASKVWHHDPYAGGAFALFTPDSRRSCIKPLSRPKDAITSRESTHLSPTPGYRGRSSPGFERHPRYIRSDIASLYNYRHGNDDG